MKSNNCFEIWLDESGDFVSDIENQKLNPSLVGGLLIKVGIIDEVEAGKILDKEYVHFNEENGGVSIEVLRRIAQYSGDFVVFENRERLLIIDSDVTYLNILSEGIIKLLLFLNAKHGDFELDIRVATRKNTVKGYGILSEEEYEKRLREKVVLGLARNTLTRKSEWKYRISFDDARTSKRLMLADCICNTYLTRTSGKFIQEHKQIIDSLYKKEYMFPIFENTAETEMKRAIAEGKFGDVIFELYFNSDFNEQREKYLELTLDRLQDFNQFALKNHLMSISTKVDTLLRVEKDYSTLKNILVKVQNELIPILKSRGIYITEFVLDIVLYLYTIYTHEGSLEANKQDEIFVEELDNLKDLFVRFKYFIMYKTRQAIHQKNMLDVDGSICNITKVISVMEQMKQLMTILDDSEESMLGDKNIMIAKAYGTRLQSWTMQIYKDKEYILKARKDYELAVEHFSDERDKVRQHLYLCQAECESGNWKNAITLMLRSENIEYDNEGSLEVFLYKISRQRINDAIYKYLAFIRIMAYAKEERDSLADYMFGIISKYSNNIENFKTNYPGVHPLEMIYWFMGDYFFLNGKLKKACKYYDLAIDLCNLGQKEVTIRVIKMGVLSSKILAYLNNNKKSEANVVMGRLITEYGCLEKEKIPETLMVYLDALENIKKEILDKVALKEFVLMTRAIN